MELRNLYKVLFVFKIMSVLVKLSPPWSAVTMNKRMLKSLIDNSDAVYLRAIHLSYESNPKCLRLGGSCETCKGICSCDATLERRSIILNQETKGDCFSSKWSPLRAAEFDSEGRLNIHSINLSDFLPFIQSSPLQDGQDNTKYCFFYDRTKENGRNNEYHLFVLPGIRNIVKTERMLAEGKDVVKAGYMNDYVREDLRLSTNDVIKSEDEVRRALKRIGKERALALV